MARKKGSLNKKGKDKSDIEQNPNVLQSDVPSPIGNPIKVFNERGPVGVISNSSVEPNEEPTGIDRETVDWWKSGVENVPGKGKSVMPNQETDSYLVDDITHLVDDITQYIVLEKEKGKFTLPPTAVEIDRFTKQCLCFNLNPAKGEIFLIETDDIFHPGSIEHIGVISYRVVIERVQDMFPGSFSWTFIIEEGKNPFNGSPDVKGASTIVFQKIPGVSMASTCIFWYSDIKKNTQGHRRMPGFMFAKTAYVQHLRFVFAKEMKGLPFAIEEIEPKSSGVTASESKQAESKVQPKPSYKKYDESKTTRSLPPVDPTIAEMTGKSTGTEKIDAVNVDVPPYKIDTVFVEKLRKMSPPQMMYTAGQHQELGKFLQHDVLLGTRNANKIRAYLEDGKMTSDQAQKIITHEKALFDVMVRIKENVIKRVMEWYPNLPAEPRVKAVLSIFHDFQYDEKNGYIVLSDASREINETQMKFIVDKVKGKTKMDMISDQFHY